MQGTKNANLMAYILQLMQKPVDSNQVGTVWPTDKPQNRLIHYVCNVFQWMQPEQLDGVELNWTEVGWARPAWIEVGG